MYYHVYVLKNLKNNELYYGYTQDLKRRLAEHNKTYEQWKIIYFEGFISESDARKREKSLKHYGQARTHLKNRIIESLKM